MKSLIVYDSLFGNTERIARSIAARLETRGSIQICTASECGPLHVEGIDLLVVGGPTHHHGISPEMQRFLDSIPQTELLDVATAAFDTRYPGAAWITGSAAAAIARILKKKGARLVDEPECFFIEKDRTPQGVKRRHEQEHLLSGEEHRASIWAWDLAIKATPILQHA